jgi:TolB-like protein/DNA-binding winged helix-turn-helix (wHTH) protein
MPSPLKVRFGPFEFDRATGELWRDGRRIPLQRQPSRLLDLLVSRAGDVVSREEIRAALWGDDTHVDFERSLNFCVAKLRAALGDNAAAPAFIETLPTRGYRWLAAATPSNPVVSTFRRKPPATVTVRWVAAIAGLAIVAVVALRVAWPLSAETPKVVVVPFHNETGSPELDRVAKGVSDATVARLATSDRLKVIGNATSVTFSFRPRDMKAMGESLGAQYLVLGQMKKDDRNMRIVAHLIRVSDQTHVWANTYDSPTLDLSQQATIAHQIATEVAIRAGKE